MDGTERVEKGGLSSKSFVYKLVNDDQVAGRYLIAERANSTGTNNGSDTKGF